MGHFLLAFVPALEQGECGKANQNDAASVRHIMSDALRYTLIEKESDEEQGAVNDQRRTHQDEQRDRPAFERHLGQSDHVERARHHPSHDPHSCSQKQQLHRESDCAGASSSGRQG